MFKRLTIELRSCVACTALLMAGPAWAADRTFNIEAQEASTAITEFARQSGIRIIAPADGLAGVRVKELRGTFDDRAALRRLIGGTGLEIVSDNNGVILLRLKRSVQATAASFHADDATDPAHATDATDDIVVTGRAQRLYRVDHAASGKLDTPPLESSLNIQTINNQLLEDQGARTGQDLYRNLAGISAYSYSVVSARGFKQEENFFDGLRGDPYVGLSVPQLFNVERVEYLKGPAGMLYGPAAPGGILNYISKKPTDVRSGRATLIGGTRSRFGGSLELGGLLSDMDGAPATRLGLFYESMNLPRNNANSRTFIADGGMAFNIGDAKLTLQATHYNQSMAGARLRGVPTDDQGNFLGSRTWNTNEKKDGTRLNSNAFQASFDWAVSDAFEFDVAARYSRGTEASQYHEPDRLRDSDGDGLPDLVSRRYRNTFRIIDNFAANANARWSHGIGNVEGRLLAGIDYFYTRQDYTRRYEARGTFVATPGLPAPISLQNPEYGVSDPATYNLRPIGGTISSRNQIGGYLLEELNFGRLILTGGLRIDRFVDNISRGAVQSLSDSALTYRIGGVYRITDEISAYGQWANSFEAQSIGSQAPEFGGPFSPSKAKMIEGGIKTSLLNGRIQSTAAVYQIKKTNILQSDPNGATPEALIAFGEVTSRGAEFDISADVTRNWLVMLNYSYNDARITKGAAGLDGAVSDRFANAPRHKLGFWSRYQIAGTPFAAAIGGDVVGERLSEAGQRVKPYAVLDASIMYEDGPWKALIRIDNILDKTYAVSGFRANTGHFPGAPRSAFLEISRKW
ncbi:MAG: TonB-dependent receptor [Sphingopyxis sp.]|nr:TonB-dependent receptor [Sphingopyxis sp.]